MRIPRTSPAPGVRSDYRSPDVPDRPGSCLMGGPLTLAVDVGGSGLKATVLSPDGEMLTERVRRDTPYPCTPAVLLDELTALTAEVGHDYDRVSVGYPGA